MKKINTQQVSTSALNIAYEENGAADHCPVILLHGFPDDVRAYDEVVPELVKHGYRTIVPYLRGYGKTQFLNSSIVRSGQQAALGNDLLELINALKIDKAILVGYDWGGRAACIVSALWPERVKGLVTVGGYNIQKISSACEPLTPEQESLYWYMWYFNTERGRAGLEKNRRELCRLLWQQWCPNWKFTREEYDRTAVSFDNPDFVEVVIHSYRHRLGNVKGDPSLEFIEEKLVTQPTIKIPTIVLDGACDGLDLPGEVPPDEPQFFSDSYERRVIPFAGHLLPRESPSSVVQAVLDVSRVSL